MLPAVRYAHRYGRYLAWITALALLWAASGCSMSTERAHAPEITTIPRLATAPTTPARSVSTETLSPPTATATHQPTFTAMPTAEPTSTATVTFTPTEPPAPSPTLSATPEADASADWETYTAGAHHFSLAVPDEWQVVNEFATGVVFEAHRTQMIGIDVFDFEAMGSLQSGSDLERIAEAVIDIGGFVGETITVHTRQTLDSPAPMVYLEYLVEQQDSGWLEHRAMVYGTPLEGWSVMAHISRPDAPPEPEEIDALLQALATLELTPDERVEFFAYPDDVDDPARWAKYYGDAFTLRHPSSWMVLGGEEEGVMFDMLPLGSMMVIVMPVDGPDEFIGDPAAIDSLVAWLMVTDGWEALTKANILQQGSRMEPLPMNYVEISLVNVLGATGHRVFIKGDLGNGHAVYIILSREIGLFAPGEMEAVYTLLTTIDVK